MKRILIATVAAATLALAACGSSSSGGGLSANQQKAVDSLNKSLAKEGMSADAACVNKIAKQLSDADAKLLAESTDAPDDTATQKLSAAGQAVAAQAMTCVPKSALTASLMKSLTESGAPVDQACVQKILDGLTNDQLVALSKAGLSGDQSSAAFTDFTTKITGCLKTGS